MIQASSCTLKLADIAVHCPQTEISVKVHDNRPRGHGVQCNETMQNKFAREHK